MVSDLRQAHSEYHRLESPLTTARPTQSVLLGTVSPGRDKSVVAYSRPSGYYVAITSKVPTPPTDRRRRPPITPLGE